MFRIMLQKLIHKKWMAISLLIGNILLIAVAVSHPMYKDASLQRMFNDEFDSYLDDNNQNPTVTTIVGKIRKDEDNPDYARLKELADTMCEKLSVEETVKSTHHSLMLSTIYSEDTDEGEQKVKLGSLSDLPDNSRLISGEMYSDTIGADGYIDAVVSVSGFVEMNMIVGKEIEFLYIKTPDNMPVKLRITGVFTKADGSDGFWVESPESFNNEILISPVIFEQLFIDGGGKYNINTVWNVQFDYTKVSYEEADELLARSEELLSYDGYGGSVSTPAYPELIKNFRISQKKVDVTLTILQVPVLVLLCVFLFMISGQILAMEENEISLFKSRGASKGQIFMLYLMQSVFLALLALLAGIPLGTMICRALGSASAFLEFVSRRSLNISITPKVMLYALAAAAVSVIMTVIPALRQSGISIVKHKQSKARRRKPLWQKLYLDVIVFGLSLYGYYSFNSNTARLEGDVLSGKALDPLLFFSSSLFILGLSLLCLRIHPLIVRLIYTIGKKRWRPAEYASFLQIIRTGPKQYFIMTFLMLTMALGIFNTTVARSILSNARNNMEYLNGADLVIEEVWQNNEASRRMDPSLPLIYYEPDYGKYGEIADVNSMAKVYVNDNVTIKDGQTVTVMGIHTKSFGETIRMDSALLSEHINTYLNRLAANAGGVLLSANFRDKLGYKVGDRITYSDKDGGSIEAVVCDFVEYFPGYMQTKSGVSPDGEAYTDNNYLIVAHLSTIQSAWGMRPYQIWFNVDNTDAFYRYIEDKGIKLTMCEDSAAKFIKIKQDTLFEGTNGILTMSFIVILILCGAGYLIYWVLSIKQRELLFGVFRAMGMSKKEVIRMLINEQISSSAVSVVFGTAIGFLASYLFVPMIQIAYSAANQAVPLKLFTQNGDLVRLFAVTGTVFVVCLVILIKQVFGMKITNALKLGED